MVSIIVPVYNTQDYLNECLNSLVNQTYKCIEIILVDDGSTDNSLAICKEYAEKYEQIVLFQKMNGGLSDARNFGVKHAKGEYILFVDSDDYLEKNTVNVLVKLIKKYDADISLCLRVGHILCNDGIRVLDGKSMLMHVLNNSCFEAWGKLYKRSLFCDDVFPVGKIHEDLYAMPEVFIKSKRCVIIHRGYYNYRLRQESIMGEVNRANLKEISSCCVDNIFSIEKKSNKSNKRFISEFQKWHYYHMLWYFYEIVCNLDEENSKQPLESIQYFYRRTFTKYWRNPYVKIFDKFRFTLLVFIPGYVRHYSISKYKKANE